MMEVTFNYASLSMCVAIQNKAFGIWSITAECFFLVTMILYFLTCFVQPGFVRPKFEIMVSSTHSSLIFA